jgi:methionine sulfoxide reductase catalytic subunit
MLTRAKRGWELPESAATPEHLFLDRRSFLKSAAAGSILAAASPLLDTLPAEAEGAAYPFPANDRYKLDREITPEKLNVQYNNYYEFGSQKEIAKQADRLVIKPWTVTVDGMVDKPVKLDVDDLLAKLPKEERLYRHRCVEAWSMAVPWEGVPLAKLVEMVQPQAGAKYVRFESFKRPEQAPGQRQIWYPWPYIEGVTIDEATNELPFLVTGAYGKPLANSMGAPLRLALPWKYGFKSAKGIVRISFTDQRPKTFWEALGPEEYGFWANVNPQVPHPRWSQANERVLGTSERVPTQLFNGYGEFVADLYKGRESEKLYM